MSDNSGIATRPGMVSIVTVNFNQTELTCALLDSIRRQEYRDVEVFVVDNGSVEDPSGVFQLRYPEVICIRSEKNLGFAGGNNLALPLATGDYLFFVNNDAEITDGCIGTLVRFLEETPGAGIVSPIICYERPSAVIQYAGMPRVNPFTSRSRMEGNGVEDRGQYTAPFRTGYAHGAAMMIRREVLAKVGPMREDYFLYYEEVDWCERMHRAGYTVWVEPRALATHKESMTMKRLGTAKTYYLTRNRVWFMRQHYGDGHFAVFTLFLIFVTMPKHVFTYLLHGEGGAARAFLKGLKHGFTAGL